MTFVSRRLDAASPLFVFMFGAWRQVEWHVARIPDLRSMVEPQARFIFLGRVGGRNGSMLVVVSARRVGIILSIAILFVLVGHVIGQYIEKFRGDPMLWGLVPLLNMNAEMSVAAWYSSLLLIVSAGLFAIAAGIARQTGAPFARSWTGLAVVFVYLSLDEAASIHEWSIAPLRERFGITEGWLYFAWVVPAAALVVIFAIAYVPFLLRLPSTTRTGFIVAGMVFVGGALGVETISAWYNTTRGGNDYIYQLIGAVEEVFEMAGIVILLMTLISYLDDQTESIPLRFVRG